MEEDAGWKHYLQIVQTGERSLPGLQPEPGCRAGCQLLPWPEALCIAPSAAVLRSPGLSCIRTSLEMAVWKLGKVRCGTG